MFVWWEDCSPPVEKKKRLFVLSDFILNLPICFWNAGLDLLMVINSQPRLHDHHMIAEDREIFKFVSQAIQPVVLSAKHMFPQSISDIFE